jgi:alkyl hydroperoxide reductase subunit AhpF
MALIADNDRETIRAHFDESLSGDVEIVMFTERESPIIIPGRQPCEMCAQTEELLEEVASLSEKLKLTVHEISSAKEQAFALGINRVPAFIFKGASRGRVRFFGIPSGYEFSALIADLVDVSNGTTDLAQETREYLSALTEDVNIKVFTTPT